MSQQTTNAQKVKALCMLAFTSALTAATLWPLLFDILEWLASSLGHDAKYLAFDTMPYVYFICASLVGILLTYYAFQLSVSLMTILAATWLPGGDIGNGANTRTIEESGRDINIMWKSVYVLAVFLIVFSIALLTMNNRFEAIGSQSKIKHLEDKVRVLEAKLKLKE
jgi:preprotein translocase subunit SecG